MTTTTAVGTFEAAVAFAVRLRTASKVRKPKAKVVEEVVAAVAMARSIQSEEPGEHAATDRARRAMRLTTMRHNLAVKTALQQLPWVLSMETLTIDEAREQVLLYECPEDLRIAVVVEFVTRARRAPAIDAGLPERTAAKYLHSAMEHRYMSTSGGQQLSQEQVASWEQCLASCRSEHR